MNILEKIVEVKRSEVATRKQVVSAKDLQARAPFGRDTVSLAARFREQVGIIAEFKRRSPSKSAINLTAKVEDVAQGYLAGGASAMSVLTDEKFFGGCDSDLILARQNTTVPILRKDFTIDEYQILEAKSIGADMILLIAAILTPEQIKAFAKLARQLGLEVLLEVHDEDELQRSICEDVTFVGVNNRNLKTFEVSIETSLRLGEMIPDAFLKVSESGISKASSILTLKEAGFHGFLVGECFMKTEEPGKACREMVDAISPIRKMI